MKLRIAVVALVAALAGTSVAVAKNNPGRGQGKSHAKAGKPAGQACTPRARVMVVLKGTLANDPVAGDLSFQLTAVKANRHGRAYLTAAQPLTINVDAKTKYRRKAPGTAPTRTLDSLAMNDWVKVKSKVCKGDLRQGGTPALTARHVKARGPAPTPPPPPPPPPAPTP